MTKLIMDLDIQKFLGRKLPQPISRLKLTIERMPRWAWAITIFVSMFFVPPAWDSLQYYCAARAWPNPFAGVPLTTLVGGGYYGIFVPWAVPLFLPFAQFPPVIGAAVIQTATVIVLYHLTGRDLWKTVVVCLSPASIGLIGSGNIDAIASAGVLLTGAGAIMLLFFKPQVAVLATLPIVLRDGWKQLVFPVLIVGFSTILWPEWIQRTMLATAGQRWNWSLFPFSFPFALALFFWSCKRRDPILAALATPTLPCSLCSFAAGRAWPGSHGL